MEMGERAGTDSEHGSQHGDGEGGSVSARIRAAGNTQRPPRELILMGAHVGTPG